MAMLTADAGDATGWQMSVGGAAFPDDLDHRLRAYGFKLGVGAGGHDASTFGVNVWLRLLGIDSTEPSGVNDQLDWFLDHLKEVRKAVQEDANIQDTLTGVNWTFVKKALGLGPEAVRDDPRTWRRA